MRRFLVVLLAVGLGTPATRSLAEELAPTDARVISGAVDCCPGTLLCSETSRDVEALAETDGVCMKFTFSNPVVVELVFETTQEPEPFLLHVTPAGAWRQAVALQDWENGGFHEVTLSPLPGAEATLSGIVSGDYVEEGTGRIVLRLTSMLDVDVGDEKTLDEVEIVIPPPK